MKRRERFAVLLLAGIVALSPTAGVLADEMTYVTEDISEFYDEDFDDEFEEESEEEFFSENNGESSLETETSIGDEEDLDESVVEEVTEGRQGAESSANSFRFTNGMIDVLFEANAKAWSYDGKGWLNSEGGYIQNAVQKGIDISTFNIIYDWEAVKKDGVSFAIIRCGYGANTSDRDDEKWLSNVAGCVNAGLPFGVYLYSYATTVEQAKSEAEHVLRCLEQINVRPDLPIYYDLEDSYTTGLCSNKQIADMAVAFCDTLNAKGYNVGIYANTSWFRNKLTDSRLDNYSKWVAQYYYQCEYEKPYDIWQASGSGHVDGITGYVDIDFSMTDISNLSSYYDKEEDPRAWKPVEEQVTLFVDRLYENILNRKPDAAGEAYWVKKLMNKEADAASVTKGFFESKEFTGKNYADDIYIERLYDTCLGRKSDEKGKKGWLAELTAGMSREYVMKGFIESEEFDAICKDLNIKRGNITLSDETDRYPGVKKYIYRCYRVFLGREPDQTGLKYWVTKLGNKNETAKEVAKGFVFSKEMNNKKLTDTEFVKLLYKGLLNRNYDEKGLAYWENKLETNSREDIFNGFADSTEFEKLIASYNIK